MSLTLGINLIIGLDSVIGTGVPPSILYYRRPGGVFLYRRPDGTSLYRRPYAG